MSTTTTANIPTINNCQAPSTPEYEIPPPTSRPAKSVGSIGIIAKIHTEKISTTMSVPTAKLHLSSRGGRPAEVRRLGPSSGVLTSVSALTDRIKAIWGDDVDEKGIRISWKDSDSDVVVIETDGELEEAMNHTVDDILHLYITDVTQAHEKPDHPQRRHRGRHGGWGRQGHGFRRMMAEGGAPHGFHRMLREWGMPQQMMAAEQMMEGDEEQNKETASADPEKSAGKADHPAKKGKQNKAAGTEKTTAQSENTPIDGTNKPSTSGEKHEQSSPTPDVNMFPGWWGRAARHWGYERPLEEDEAWETEYSAHDPIPMGETDDTHDEDEEGAEGQEETEDIAPEGEEEENCGFFSGPCGGMGSLWEGMMGRGGGRGGMMGWGQGGRRGWGGMGFGRGGMKCGRGRMGFGRGGMGCGMGGMGFGRGGMGCGRGGMGFGRGGMGFGRGGIGYGGRGLWCGRGGIGFGRGGMGFGRGGMGSHHGGMMWDGNFMGMGCERHGMGMGCRGKMMWGHGGMNGMGFGGGWMKGSKGMKECGGEMEDTIGHREMMGRHMFKKMMRKQMMGRMMRKSFPWKYGKMMEHCHRSAGRHGGMPHCPRFHAGFPHMRRQRMAQRMLARRIRRLRARCQRLRMAKEFRMRKMQEMMGTSGEDESSGSDDESPDDVRAFFMTHPDGMDRHQRMPGWRRHQMSSHKRHHGDAPCNRNWGRVWDRKC